MTTRTCLFALCFALAACGSDDKKTTPPPTDAGAHHDAATDSGAFGNVACNEHGSGKCENAADCPIVTAGTARTAAENCGLGCLNDPNRADCARMCVVKQSGVSGDCAGCYADIVIYTFDNCVGNCAADPESQQCFDCQVDKGCRSAFDSCSGLPPAKRP